MAIRILDFCNIQTEGFRNKALWQRCLDGFWDLSVFEKCMLAGGIFVSLFIILRLFDKIFGEVE